MHRSRRGMIKLDAINPFLRHQSHQYVGLIRERKKNVVKEKENVRSCFYGKYDCWLNTFWNRSSRRFFLNALLMNRQHNLKHYSVRLSSSIKTVISSGRGVPPISMCN